MISARRHDAFISYRRADGTRVARWLRNRLQSYRPPKRLGRPERPLDVYLDTSYETAATNFYEDNILPALTASAHLIVVATPACLEPGADGGPNWVVRELTDFRLLSRKDHVMVVIGADLPDTRLPGDLDQTFPNLERVDLRDAGRFLWKGRARLHEEFLKLAAPLWGVRPEEMPLLRQEEARRRARRLSFILASAVALLVTMAALLVWGMVNLASARRQLVANHLVQGENQVGTAPAEARLHFVRAIEIAEESRLPFVRLGAEAATARAWLGVHYRGESVQILEHPDAIQWARFDSRSSRLATAGNDGVIRVWNEDGRLLAHSPPQGAPLMWVAFDRAGQRIAFATDLPKQGIAVWELQTNRVTHVFDGELLRPQYGPGHDDVIAVAETNDRLRVWSIDGGFRGPPIAVNLRNRLVLSPQADFAAVSGDGTLTLWEVATGRKVAALPFASIETAVAFSGDGRRLLIPVGEHAVQTFDTVSGRAVSAPIVVPRLIGYAALDGGGTRAVITWSADDNVSPQRSMEWMELRDVATGGYLMPPQQVEEPMVQPRFLTKSDSVLTVDRSEVRLWRAATGLAVARSASQDQFIDLAADEAHGLVALTTAAGAVEILDLDTLEPSRTRIEHAGSVDGVHFSGDGKRIATFGSDRTVRIADTRRRPAVTVLRAAARIEDFQVENAISSAAVSDDGHAVAAANGRGVDLWLDGHGPTHLLDCAATAVAFARDGSLAAGCRDRGAWIFNGRGKLLRRVHGTRQIACLDYSPDGSRLLVCDQGKAWLWDVRRGTVAMPALTHPKGVRNAIISPDGRWIATAGNDETTIIHDALSGLASSPRLSTYAVSELAFSTDSRMIATSGRAARVWRVPDGHPLTAELRNPNAFRPLSFSSDQRRLLTGGLNGESQVWDLSTSRPDGPALSDRGAIWNAAFSPDGSRIVTGTFDHRVTLWDSASKRPMLPPLPVEGSVLVARFDRAGRRVLIGSAFGALLLWDVTPAAGGAAALRRLAEHDSGRTIDETTGLVRVIRP